jgi:hypothetical protein
MKKIAVIISFGILIWLIDTPVLNIIGILSFLAMFLYVVIGKDFLQIAKKKSFREAIKVLRDEPVKE